MTFARLCGVAPIPASSGRTDRHRLHRGGDREANRALWRITLVRMRCHQPTKDYVTRRTAEGKTKTEIMRCLKRYVARETFSLLVATPIGDPSIGHYEHQRLRPPATGEASTCSAFSC